jgi:hypothetical protein
MTDGQNQWPLINLPMRLTNPEASGGIESLSARPPTDERGPCPVLAPRLMSR